MKVVVNKEVIQILIEEKIWKILDKRLYANHLKKIQSCKNRKGLSDLFSVLEPKVALGYAYKLLAMRGYLENQLRKKLIDKHFPDSVVEEILRHCRREGYLDDTREMSLLIERAKRKGKGPKIIERQLQNEAGESELGKILMKELFSDEIQREQIRKILARRFPDLSTVKIKSRAFRFLQRQGFSESLIHEFLFMN